MTSNSNQITICVYPSRKTKKLFAKNQSRKNKENQVIEHMRNQLYQPEEENFDEGIGK
jgi:hypothetical protein